MCGLWVPKVRLKLQADQNLSLALLCASQLYYLWYAVNTHWQRTTDGSDSSQDILDELYPGDSAEDDLDIDTHQVCALEDYTAILHLPVKEHLNLTLKDARLLRSFITFDNSDDDSNLQSLDNTKAAASTCMRGRAYNDTLTSAKVRLWRYLAINDYSVEQQLFKAYIRSLCFEKLNERDATFVRIQYKDRGNAVGGFVRINYFFVYDDGCKSHMQANIDIISTASMDI